jgi:energy-coupling factor transporter ATP-binding protein EcfA2
MPQEAPFLDGLSILDNVRLLGDGCTDTSALRGELEDVLYQLGVDHELNTSVEVLSGGERQRVAIARCLLNRTAELFCLDEPFSHIDQYNRRRAMDMVYRHSVERKRSFLVVSHDVADLIPFASSVILFANHTPEETLGAAWRLTGDDTYSEIPEDLRRALPADEGLTLVLPENGGTAIPRRVSREDLEICDADREMGIDAWMLGPGLYDRDLMTLFVPAQKICMDGKVGAVVAGSVVMHCSRSVRRGVRVRLSHKSGRF